jgi:hypothetical protein
VREEENELDDAILEFISESERIYLVSYFAKWRAEAKKPDTVIRFRFDRDHTALCFAATFGLVKTVKTLLQTSAYRREADVPMCGDTPGIMQLKMHIPRSYNCCCRGVQIDVCNAVGETALDLTIMGTTAG